MTILDRAPHRSEREPDPLLLEEADYDDEPQRGRRLGWRTYATAGGLVLVLGIGLLGGRFFNKGDSEPDAGKPGGDRAAVGPVVDPTHAPTPGGSFGKLALTCTGVDVDRNGNGYTYTPETQVAAGNADSARLFTVVIYSEFGTGTDKTRASGGISPVSFDASRGIPAAVAVVDFSDTPNPPDSAEEVPHIKDLSALTRSDQAEIFGCPAGINLDPAGLALAPQG